MSVIDPRGMTVTDWTDRMALQIGNSGVLVERLDDPKEWRDWAAELLDSPTLEGQNAPNPYQFESWVEWAMRFNQAVELPG